MESADARSPAAHVREAVAAELSEVDTWRVDIFHDSAELGYQHSIPGQALSEVMDYQDVVKRCNSGSNDWLAYTLLASERKLFEQFRAIRRF